MLELGQQSSNMGEDAAEGNTARHNSESCTFRLFIHCLRTVSRVASARSFCVYPRPPTSLPTVVHTYNNPVIHLLELVRKLQPVFAFLYMHIQAGGVVESSLRHLLSIRCTRASWRWDLSGSEVVSVLYLMVGFG